MIVQLSTVSPDFACQWCVVYAIYIYTHTHKACNQGSLTLQAKYNQWACPGPATKKGRKNIYKLNLGIIKKFQSVTYVPYLVELVEYTIDAGEERPANQHLNKYTAYTPATQKKRPNILRVCSEMMFPNMQFHFDFFLMLAIKMGDICSPHFLHTHQMVE